MCGITGLSRAQPETSIPDGRDWAIAAVLAIQSRGPHATGFGWADQSGHPWYWKQAGRAADVARHAPLPDHLRTLIGHTRWATQGDPKHNENNHPVVAEGLVLVHNGGVSNDAELFRKLRTERTAEVDSEVLAALLSYGPSVLGAEHPADLLEMVRGSAAIAWLDMDSPYELHLARLSTRPMAVGRTKRHDLLMSSTPQTLGLTARLGRVGVEQVKEIPEGTYLRVRDGEVVEQRRFRVPRTTYGWRPEPAHGAEAKRPLKAQPQPKRKKPKHGKKPTHLKVVHDGLVETIPEWRRNQLNRTASYMPITRGRSRWSTAEQRWIPEEEL